MSLTRRQSEIYDFLQDQILNRGYGPTVREIGEHFSIKSPNGVMCHLKALEKKGLIRRESNMSRAICLTTTQRNRMAMPLIGTANAGEPIHMAVSSDETVDFECVLSGDDRACVHVKGCDFESLGINDGDHVIVSKNSRQSGECLLAGLDRDHHLAFYRLADPASHPVPAISGVAAGPPRQILGVVVGVIRSFSPPSTEPSSGKHTASPHI